jgi:hypothetical protein
LEDPTAFKGVSERRQKAEDVVFLAIMFIQINNPSIYRPLKLCSPGREILHGSLQDEPVSNGMVCPYRDRDRNDRTCGDPGAGERGDIAGPSQWRDDHGGQLPTPFKVLTFENC